MKRLIFGVLILVGLLIVAAATIPFLVPKEVYKQQIQAATTTALDRDVTLEGDVHLSVFPTLSVGIDGLTIANAEGFEGDYLLKAGQLRASVKVLPLLSKRVEVATLSFVDADVNLIRNADGEVNWAFGAASEESDSESSAPSDFDAGIERAQLVNAALRYSDNVAGTAYSIEGVNASARMRSLDDPFEASIEGLFDARAFAGDVNITRPRALLESEPTNIRGQFEIANARIGYDGAVTLAEVPALEGAIDLSVDGLDELVSLLQLEVTGAELIGDVRLKADVDGSAEALSVRNIALTHKSDAFSAGYNGDAQLSPEVASFEGNLSFETDSVEVITGALEIEQAGTELADQIRLSTDLSGRAELGSDTPVLDVTLQNIDASHKGQAFNAVYNGNASLQGETVGFDGNFSFDTNQIERLVAALKLELAGTDQLDTVRISGKVDGQTTPAALAVNVSELSASHTGDAFAADYTGAVRLIDEDVSLDGRFNFNASNVGELAKRLELDVAGLDAIEAVTLQGNVSGAPETLNLSGLIARHEGRLLTASFEGDVSLAGAGRLDGQLAAASSELRALMAAADVELTEGETLQSFDVAGSVGGTLEQITVDLTKAKLDDMSATGKIGLDLRGQRPVATINASTDVLDLTPFMTADPDAPPTDGWSKEPLPLESLSLADATFDLSVDTLTIDKVVLKNASLNGTLRNGDLKVTMPGFQTFGGGWSGTLDLATSGATPTLGLDFKGESIQLQSLVQTFTGIDRLSGAGGLTFKATSQGTSLYELVNGLNGGLSTNMGEGIIRGFNAGQLMRSRESLLASVTSGNFNLPLGPSAETDFTSMTSVLTIKDGVASLDVLEVLNPFVKIEGLGNIDLGQQSLDIRLKFAGDVSGQGNNQQTIGLGGIGIPLQISGNWLSPSIRPDASAVQSALAASVVNRVAPNLESVVGGEAGGLISGILGGGQTPAPAQPGGTAANPAQADKKDAKPADPTEELVESLAKEALGGLFGRRRAPEEKKDEEKKDGN